MRVLLTAIGSAGDVLPSVGLALRLKERGHDPVLLTNPHFAPLARRFDLPFVGVGTTEDYVRITHNSDVWHPRRGFATVAESVMALTPALYAALEGQIAPGRTIIAAHVLDFASRLLQERRGVPVATLLLSPALLRSVHRVPTLSGTQNLSWLPAWAKRRAWSLADRFLIDPIIVPPLNHFRAELALPPVRRPLHGWLFSPRRVIGLFPPWFAPPQPDWPSQLRLTNFPLFDTTAPVPEDLECFLAAGEAPVAVTLGTAMVFGLSHLTAAVGALRALGRRGVLLASSDQAPALPPEIRQFDYAPLSRILPRCAALVHHGGIGTTAAALAAGVPQVVMPMSHDQPDNAARVRRLGVGTTLLPPHFRASTLANTLGPLLASSAVQARVAAVAERTRESDGLAASCAELEAVAEVG